ncbi:Penicillin-binding protein 1A [Kingella potus]|uniref:Penicillin-binding protein 1A n=1 Tax=Kingella potus TaxID=265175 RepID=A0A377R1Q6_9NEIS|nr:penicillin-binding protein 1A [Kingella potus]STR02677.1 Penicillin-binding protein 1A [Kingella potus]
MIKKIFTTLLGLSIGFALFAVGLLAIAVLTTYPKLPSLDAVQNYQPKMPLTIYSADGKLIGSYGEERRAFTEIKEFPQVLKNAVIAAEDKRFYEHWGVDVIGVARAVISNIRGGAVQSGASTITQQVARNFYLTNERTLTRKFNEALLAYKIEQSLTKDQILELYFNQIYLGQRAYGFAAASQVYFNKPVQDLTLAEASMLAGLPKFPSAANPLVNPKRAKQRQEYILNNMVELGMITQNEKEAAFKEELHYERHVQDIDQTSLYVAEMARQELYEKYGDDAYTQGFKVYTTVDTDSQRVATNALRKTLRGFDRSSSYRGAEGQLDLGKDTDEDIEEAVGKYLSTMHAVDGLEPAVVIEASKSKGITAQTSGGEQVRLTPAQMGGARSAILNAKLEDAQIRPGAIIRLQKTKNGWRIGQEPALQGALVALDARTGAVKALVGGYNFHSKNFNRATQALRQPGSSFKPFIYSAGLSRGMTAATLINDDPISIPGAGRGGRPWTPKNSDGRYDGPITLRQALTRSKNMVSIRILMAAGVNYTQQYIQKFGFKPNNHPANLSMALGAGASTPIQMAEGYAVFANGGYRVSAYVIDKIYDSQDHLKAQMQPLVAGENAPQVIDPRNAYIMYKMMQDVVKYGTARGALALGRSDIAGKTGTTNDNKDAWFVGFNPDIVTAVYIGFDKPRSMGRAGYGGTIALPVWVEYMRYALKGKPSTGMKVPGGMVLRGGEYFYKEHQTTDPSLRIDNSSSRSDSDGSESSAAKPAGTAGGAEDTGERELKPTNTGGERELTPTNRKPAPSSDLDDLF